MASSSGMVLAGTIETSEVALVHDVTLLPGLQ
jgi:hypothetical protein